MMNSPLSVSYGEDISIVVQGPVVGTASDGDRPGSTRRCLSTVRSLLPKAEIVLSTWRGSDVSGLSYDVLVENADPGAVEFDAHPGSYNNVNRQIVTTHSGLQAATRPYSLKLRSDMEIRHVGFLSYFGRFPRRCGWSFLDNKVVASTIFSRIPGAIFDWPYHPGDWFFFGLTQDVRAIWEIPLALEPELTRWFLNRPRPPRDRHPQSMSKYTAEQYIWLSFLRKYRAIPCEYQWDLSDETRTGTELSFAGNLVLVSPRQAGLLFPKYKTFYNNRLAWAHGCYTHTLWRALYERHCLGRPWTWRALGQAPPLIARAVTVEHAVREKAKRALVKIGGAYLKRRLGDYN